MARKYPVTLERSPGFERTKRVLSNASAPMTVKQIADLAACSFCMVKNYYIPRLISEKQAHISDWHAYQYGHVPMYSAGQGRAAKRPTPALSTQERCRQWKRRTGYYETYNAFRRALSRIGKPRDPVMKALTGGTPAP